MLLIARLRAAPATTTRGVIELIAPLIALAAALWLWRDSLRAREAAIAICKRVCTAEQVQLLDDTVALAALWPQLSRGGLRLKRVYGFEFSREGVERRHGSITLLGTSLLAFYMSDDDV